MDLSLLKVDANVEIYHQARQARKVHWLFLVFFADFA